MVPDEPAMVAARQALEGRAGVIAVDVLDDHLEVSVADDLDDAALLAHLVRRRVRVRAFAPIAGDLSEAFMRLTGPRPVEEP